MGKMSNFQSLASRLFAFEEGQLSEEETLVLFQDLVDSGMIQPARLEDILDILPASQ